MAFRREFRRRGGARSKGEEPAPVRVNRSCGSVAGGDWLPPARPGAPAPGGRVAPAARPTSLAPRGPPGGAHAGGGLVRVANCRSTRGSSLARVVGLFSYVVLAAAGAGGRRRRDVIVVEPAPPVLGLLGAGLKL